MLQLDLADLTSEVDSFEVKTDVSSNSMLFWFHMDKNLSKSFETQSEICPIIPRYLGSVQETCVSGEPRLEFFVLNPCS